MDHVTAIRQYIEVMTVSLDNHVLIIEGPAGWGKSSTVELALRKVGIEGFHLGAYSTPLNLYNFVCQNSDKMILIDDTSGVYTDQSSMAILKAATWPLRDGKRIVRWGSTSRRALAEEFQFKGKFIMICNSFPHTPDADAIRSRGFARTIEITVTEAKTLLMEAARNTERFPDSELATEVAQFLCERISTQTISKISFRTLGMGYELAKIHSGSWQQLLAPMLPLDKADPVTLALELAKQDIKVKEQARIFEQKTGLKERSFFKYRNMAKVSKRS